MRVLTKTMARVPAVIFALGVSISGLAAQQSDAENVKNAINALHSALSARDAEKIMSLWATGSSVMAVQPRDKSIAVGSEAVRKGFENAVAAWSDLKVTQSSGPDIQVSGNTAWAIGIALAAGHLKSGGTTSSPTFETDVLEKRGDRWVFLSHVALRVPQ